MTLEGIRLIRLTVQGLFVVKTPSATRYYLHISSTSQMRCALCFKKANRLDIFCCAKLPEGQETRTDSFLFRFFKKIFAPFVLKEWVRPIIVSTSVTALFSSIDPRMFFIQ